MRKKTVRTILLLAVTVIGALTATSNASIKEAKAMPYNLFLNEYHNYYPEILSEINLANITINRVLNHLISSSNCGFTPCFTDIARRWNQSMLTLISRMNALDKELTVLPYTPFSMDRLLLKIDLALENATLAATYADLLQLDTTNFYLKTSSDCTPTVTPTCIADSTYVEIFDSMTHTIKEKVIALGLLFSKAKLEMLEVPRLQCLPLRITVGGRLDCTGKSVNGTLTLRLNNTQTGQVIDLGSQGSAQADSFFDVFFEITLPSTVGAGHYQMTGTDSGGATSRSFFDVFISLPTAFEPNTIIPITVLIAAVATLVVASHKARRPL